MKRLCLLTVLNGLFGALGFIVWREGLIHEAFAADLHHVLPAILCVYAFGWIVMFRDTETAGLCAETCVLLGLLGTALGIWVAFGGIDPEAVGDVSRIGDVLEVLLGGLSSALWTTIAGLVANIMLMAQIRAVEIA